LGTGINWSEENWYVETDCAKLSVCILYEQPGRDITGATIALFTARLHQPSQTSHQAVLNALIFQLDVAMERFQHYLFLNIIVF